MHTFKKEQTKPVAAKSLDHKNKKVDVDMAFIRQIQRLLRVVMPGLRSKEFGMLVIHSGFLGNSTKEERGCHIGGLTCLAWFSL
jgi:ATP-binding cassette subfamily D (ALD) long-chain fatty acid import protein